MTLNIFAGIREVLVSPFLTSSVPWREYQRRRLALNMAPLSGDEDIQGPNESTYKDVRTGKLLDTFIAGGMTGSILSTIKSKRSSSQSYYDYNAFSGGPAALGPSFFTSGLVCSLFQLAVNEAHVMRLKYYSRAQLVAMSEPTDHPITTPTFRERLEKWQHTGEKIWKDILPRKLSDEEYAERMAAKERVLKERLAAKERAQSETEKNA